MNGRVFKAREDLLDEFVESAGDRKPEVYDDRGKWVPFDGGFENFTTTDGKSFDFVEHLGSEVADFVVAAWEVENENDFPSKEIKELWDSSEKEDVLKMRNYFFKRAESKCEDHYVRMAICTVDECFSMYMFVIVE